jgi:hypothetical protein
VNSPKLSARSESGDKLTDNPDVSQPRRRTSQLKVNPPKLSDCSESGESPSDDFNVS